MMMKIVKILLCIFRGCNWLHESSLHALESNEVAFIEVGVTSGILGREVDIQLSLSEKSALGKNISC